MQGSAATPGQAAVIPIRRADGGLQICLIRRKDRSSWSVPKGYIDPGDDWEQAALGEADEEAGLHGRILGEAIGAYDYEKGPLSLTVVVGVMEVLEERATWREMRWRERRWCSIEEAGALLREHPIWPLYERLQPTLDTILPNNRPQAPGGASTE
jgi:8-oxo-dGTP pyrophosphatase MutT (NUDIX family)